MCWGGGGSGGTAITTTLCHLLCSATRPQEVQAWFEGLPWFLQEYKAKLLPADGSAVVTRWTEQVWPAPGRGGVCVCMEKRSCIHTWAFTCQGSRQLCAVCHGHGIHAPPVPRTHTISHTAHPTYTPLGCLDLPVRLAPQPAFREAPASHKAHAFVHVASIWTRQPTIPQPAHARLA